MIITKDFVFIHMPKTGGTFVHGVFKRIIVNYKKKNLIKWYLNRLGYRLRLSVPIYQKLNYVAYYEYPDYNVIGQHAGVSFVPKKYQKLPVISVKRDPIKKFISTYYYRWWERFPDLPADKLTELIPNYPDISIEEYFELAYNHTLKYFFDTDFREDIGILSWQFIRMYSKDPLFVYKHINESNFEKFKRKYFVDVIFIEIDELSSGFKSILNKTNFAEYSDYLEIYERINFPDSNLPDPNVKKQPKKITQVLATNIKRKEWLLYKIFPEYF